MAANRVLRAGFAGRFRELLPRNPGESPSGTGDSSTKLHFLARILALTVLFSASALCEGVHLTALDAPEVWIHLRTGTWIIENHAIPRTGLFSQSNLPWIDSAWGFDVLLGGMYHPFGLRAIPLLLMLLKVALAIITFLLARAGRANFWVSVALCALAQYVISGLQPVPSVFSVLFFAIELLLLVRARQSGTARHLFWLPLLFVLWANVHLQFIAGLLLLALFLVALLCEQSLRSAGVNWLSPRIQPVPILQVSAVAALSVLGTLVTPYFLHVLPAAFHTFYSRVGFEHFSEMSSMGFRRSQDFALMLLVMTAFLALGRRRSLELFELLILVAGTLIAFRIQRDGWLAVLPAIAVISNTLIVQRDDVEPLRNALHSPERIWAAALTALVLVIATVRLPAPTTLMNKVSHEFPVKACNYIRESHLPQPLFNEYSWGSFLTWYLPEYPVAVDSRVELYGDDILTSYFDLIGGKRLLESDPMVAHAGTLLLERESAMAKALTTLPALTSQYRLLYSDDLASVFVPQPPRQ